jgi:cytochrome c oxidase subunit 4
MSNQESKIEHSHHSYSKYILVWLGLLTLTAITVAVAGVNLGKITIATAIVIASIKSYLVLTVFMHLNAESKAFKVFVGVAIFFIIVSLALLFSDFSNM